MLFVLFLPFVGLQAVIENQPIVSVSAESVVDCVKKYITDNPDTTAKCVVVGATALSIYLGYKLLKKLCTCSKKPTITPQVITQDKIVYVDRVIEKPVVVSQKPTTQHHHVSVQHHVTVDSVKTYPQQSYRQGEYECSGDFCVKKPCIKTTYVQPTPVVVHVVEQPKPDIYTTTALLISDAERRDAQIKAEQATCQAQKAQREATRIAQQQVEARKAQERAEQELAQLKKQQAQQQREEEQRIEAERHKRAAEEAQRQVLETAQRKQEKADADQDTEEHDADTGAVSFFL